MQQERNVDTSTATTVQEKWSARAGHMQCEIETDSSAKRASLLKVDGYSIIKPLHTMRWTDR